MLGLDDVAAYDEPVEDQPTFEGNALLKARAGVAATGLPSLADDSGLCVDALNGMPGVLSARWSGLPKERRRATTCCCSTSWPTYPTSGAAPSSAAPSRSATPTARRASSEGVMRGRVIRELRGSGGFGYDVLFVPDEQEGEPHLGRADRRREGPDLPPRQGAARDRPDGGRPAQVVTAGRHRDRREMNDPQMLAKTNMNSE